MASLIVQGQTLLPQSVEWTLCVLTFVALAFVARTWRK